MKKGAGATESQARVGRPGSSAVTSGLALHYDRWPPPFPPACLLIFYPIPYIRPSMDRAADDTWISWHPVRPPTTHRYPSRGNGLHGPAARASVPSPQAFQSRIGSPGPKLTRCRRCIVALHFSFSMQPVDPHRSPASPSFAPVPAAPPSAVSCTAPGSSTHAYRRERGRGGAPCTHTVPARLRGSNYSRLCPARRASSQPPCSI